MAKGWKFDHVGVVVRDLDKAVEYYQSLGIVDEVSDLMTEEGKKAKLIGRVLRIGSLNLELWQPIRGNTVQQEFLDTCGEGINHIAFAVDDYDKEYANLVDKHGIRLVFGSKPPISAEGGGAYFDTREEGHNIILELMTPTHSLERE